jgi:hypothetical protein
MKQIKRSHVPRKCGITGDHANEGVGGVGGVIGHHTGRTGAHLGTGRREGGKA